MIPKRYRKFQVRDYIEEEIKLDPKKKYIDCSLGTNVFLDPEEIKNYMKNTEYIVNCYPQAEYDNLKQELLIFWDPYLTPNINTKNVAFGSGTMGILRNILTFLIEKDTKVLGIAPQFPRFISEIELKEGIYEYYALERKNNYRFKVEDFINKMNPSYSVISIENPNNPTGQIIEVIDIEKIVQKAKEMNSIVIVDEAYGDYMPLSNSAITLIPQYSNVIVLRSGSKFLGLANHRVGYLFSSKELIEIYERIALPFPFSDFSANLFGQVLENYEKFLHTKEEIREIKKQVLKALKKENYLYTNLKTPIFTIHSNKYKNLAKKLLEEGIIAENCKYFEGLDATYARVRIPREYEQLIEVLSRIL